MLVHIVDGKMRKRYETSLRSYKQEIRRKEVGVMYPDKTPMDVLQAGQVGYIIPGMKNPREALIGDTFFQNGQHENLEPLPGFEEPKPMVFVGHFLPMEANSKL